MMNKRINIAIPNATMDGQGSTIIFKKTNKSGTRDIITIVSKYIM